MVLPQFVSHRLRPQTCRNWLRQRPQLLPLRTCVRWLQWPRCSFSTRSSVLAPACTGQNCGSSTSSSKTGHWRACLSRRRRPWRASAAGLTCLQCMAPAQQRHSNQRLSSMHSRRPYSCTRSLRLRKRKANGKSDERHGLDLNLRPNLLARQVVTVSCHVRSTVKIKTHWIRTFLRHKSWVPAEILEADASSVEQV